MEAPGKIFGTLMFKDIRLHGIMDNGIEYEAFAIGGDVSRRFFYELDLAGGGELRLFSPGNELVIRGEGVSHSGNGGLFCEYMFGVEKPLADLMKPEVRNRLLMFGTRYSPEHDSLSFSDQTSGFVSFDKLFFDGNAVCNYCFFVSAPSLGPSLSRQQETILRRIGKAIKRSTAIGSGEDDRLIDELFTLLDDPRAQLFVVKLVDTRHKRYHDLFRFLYFRNKRIPDDDYLRLTRLAEEERIDRYQQERIRIDCMYHHRENRRIVDEYRDILIACRERGGIGRLENARLTRLKTLSVRNKIPGALFHPLDQQLRVETPVDEGEEPSYIQETRQILEGLFLSVQQYISTISHDDLVSLLRNRKKALENRDRRYEGILLDASRTVDEMMRDGGDLSLLDSFTEIITLFDRYDTTASLISQLAFMETVRITDDMLKTLVRTREIFEQLSPGLFRELFIDDILASEYLGRFGREKIEAVRDCLVDRPGNASSLADRLAAIDRRERLTLQVLEILRERIRNFYVPMSSPEEIESLRRDISEELRLKRRITTPLPADLFTEVIGTIRSEAAYIHSVLPRLIAGEDLAEREEFIRNSGLDRFQIEELERDYFDHHNLPLEQLRLLQRSGDSAPLDLSLTE